MYLVFTRKIGLYLLLILTMSLVACGGGGLTVEQSVALTVAASNVEPTLSVDQIVALTVAASTAAIPDVVDPNLNITPIQPVADPASGVPQLRAALNANIRNGPGTNYRVISALLQGGTVPVIAKNQSGTWFLIELPGGSRGWIADSVTDPVNPADMANVPVAATIPAPPPPATATPVPPTTAAASPTAAALPSATPVQATVLARNSTGEAICEISITSTTGTPSGNLLGSNTLANGASQGFNVPDKDLYNLEAVTCTTNIPISLQAFVNGAFTWDIFIPIANPITTITVVNNSFTDVCLLQIDLSTMPNWTVNRLPPGFSLAPGDSINLDFPQDIYDFQALDCDSSGPFLVHDEFNVHVTGPFTWTIP